MRLTTAALIILIITTTLMTAIETSGTTTFSGPNTIRLF